MRISSTVASVLVVLAVALANPAAADSEAPSPVRLPDADIAAGHQFGIAVAVNGDWAAAGAPMMTADGAVEVGAVLLFQRTDEVWGRQTTLRAGDGQPHNRLGWSLAMHGDLLVAGAPVDDDAALNAGSAYVFRREGAVWRQEAELHAADADEGDRFGAAVAVARDLIIVGADNDEARGRASGSAYIFRHVDGAWHQQAKLLAADGKAHDVFGRAVGIDGEWAIVGALLDDEKGNTSGAAYVFRLVDGAWRQRAILTAADGQGGDYFGYPIAMSGGAALIGAFRETAGGRSAGAAYIFRLGADGWHEEAKLIASDASAGDLFGRAVALDGDRAVIGAPGDDDRGESAGSAYLFRFAGRRWVQIAKLSAGDGAAGDRFGGAVSIVGSTVVVGAAFKGDGGENTGAAYVVDVADHGNGDSAEEEGDCGGAGEATPAAVQDDAAGAARRDSTSSPSQSSH